MLKIETSSPTPSELTVVLSGRVSAEHLPGLERLLADALASNRRIWLDLRHVSLVDREAVDFLATGAARAARLRGCPAYLREWLKSVGRHAE